MLAAFFQPHFCLVRTLHSNVMLLSILEVLRISSFASMCDMECSYNWVGQLRFIVESVANVSYVAILYPYSTVFFSVILQYYSLDLRLHHFTTLEHSLLMVLSVGCI